MAVSRTEALKFVGRARRVWGNDCVETGNSRQSWMYRITCPDGYRIQIHTTPSDRNWKKTVERELNAHGLAEAEEAWLEAEEQRKFEAQKVADEKNREKLRDAERRSAELAAATRAAGPFAPQPVDMRWLFSAHEMPETRRVLLTPEISAKILDELNSANRPLRPGRVAYWANIMKKGRWRYTHQGVAFDTNGTLQDGQHRLAAAAQEGYVLDIQISVGMPSDNHGVVDVGAPRSASDTLALLGKPNYRNLSGAIRVVALYDRYGPEFRAGIKTRIPNDELEELTERYGELMDQAVAVASSLYMKNRRGGPKMSIVASGAAIYLISRNLPDGVNDDRIVEFLRGYSDGTGLFAGDARLPLRSYMSNLVDNRNHKVPVGDQLAVFLKAWNAWINNETVGVLSWRRNELMPKVEVPSILVKQKDLPKHYTEA